MYSHVSHQLFPWDQIDNWVPQVETHASQRSLEEAAMVAVEDARL
jgi:hypothetical protein